MRLTSGDTLKALMAQKDISYQEMADSADVSKGFISHLTAGRKKTCTPRVAGRIAKQLDVPLELLFVPSISSDTGRNISQGRRVA